MLTPEQLAALSIIKVNEEQQKRIAAVQHLIADVGKNPHALPMLTTVLHDILITCGFWEPAKEYTAHDLLIGLHYAASDIQLQSARLGYLLKHKAGVTQYESGVFLHSSTNVQDREYLNIREAIDAAITGADPLE